MELDALCKAALKAHPKYCEPVSAAEFEALKAKFPDTKPTESHGNR